jgi:hypothetical protein
LIDRSGIRGFHRYRDSTWAWSRAPIRDRLR